MRGGDPNNAEAGEGGGGSGEQRANNGNASHLGDGVTNNGAPAPSSI